MRPRSRHPLNPPPGRGWPALGLVLALALGLRLWVALHAPWYWDEGYVVELARSLARGGRPQVGGLWQDGFFPLSTSLLAPLTVTPFAVVPWWSPMTGARVWAVLLEGLTLLLVALLGRRAGSARLGLLAAACYAALPLAVELGGRAFYHHLAVVFLLAALLKGAGAFEAAPRRGDAAWAGLAAGLAVATCYWLWWLPLGLGLLLLWRRPPGWWVGLAWAALPPLAVLALNLWPDPAGAVWSVRSLLRASSAGGPRGLAAWAHALAQDLGAFSVLPLGLAGLGLAARREGGAWLWWLATLAMAVFEPIRQRGDIAAMPYPFMPALPLAALGAAYLFRAAWAARRTWAWIGLALALGLTFRPVDLTWMRLWSFEPAAVADLDAYFTGHARPGDAICGLPEFNWSLEPALRACEPFDVGVAEGRASGFYLPGAPASRLAWPCRLRDLRYAVLTRIQLLGAFRCDGVALSFLEMERQGWPRVFDDKVFKVYENPRFGATADPNTRLLFTPQNYRLARQQAQEAGRPGDVRFAQARLRALAGSRGP